METQNAIPEHIYAKLQKLKNLKEGAEAVGSLAEAENAAAKMYDIMMKHNLNIDEVMAHNVEKKIVMVHTKYDLDEVQAKTEAGWVEKLINVLAHHCMCRVVKHSTNRHNYDQGMVTVLGEDQNVALVFYMLEQIIAKIQIAAKISWNGYVGHEKRNTFRRGFLAGAVMAIHHKFQAQAIEYETNTSHALVLADKREKATEYMFSIFSKLKRGKSRQSNLSGRGGYVNGQEAGRKMDVNRDMKPTTKHKQIGNG